MKPSQQQEIEHSPLRMLALQVSGEGGEGEGREEKENRKEERGKRRRDEPPPTFSYVCCMMYTLCSECCVV